VERWGRRERETSIWFLICETRLVTASWVLPSPTIVVVSLVSTTLAAVPRTSFPALSKLRPTSSLITVPVSELGRYILLLTTKSKKEQKEKLYTSEFNKMSKDIKDLNL